MIPGVLLFLAVLAYRIAMANPDNRLLAGMQNFSPVGALVLCGAAFFPRRWAMLVTFAAIFVTDVILNAIYRVPLLGWAMVPQYVAFGIIAAIGWALRDNPTGGGRIFGASIMSSVLFFMVTNTASWALIPAYEGGFAGWRQALTTGLPGYAPTWQFCRNSLVSDILFTGLFVACMKMRAPAAEPAREEEVAPV